MLLAIKEIYPTQVSTFFLLTNVFHAYIKQNTPIFFSGMFVFTTSILYHNIKHYYSISDRKNLWILQIDYCMCALLYFTAIYEYLTRNSVYTPYMEICKFMHLFIPGIFLLSKSHNILMWNKDPIISERWHAFFHFIISTDMHIYFYII
jgi:hypothetical protein